MSAVNACNTLHACRKQLFGSVLFGTVAIATFSSAKPASAITPFSWTDNSVTFDASAIGSTVDIFYFDGYIDEPGFTDEFGDGPVKGLTSQLSLTLDSFSGTSATFTGQVINTMNQKFVNPGQWVDTGDNFINTGRVTGISFNVDPDVSAVTASGVFGTARLNKTFPGGVGKVDVCYTNVQTCGGSKAGVAIGDTGIFTTTLSWGSSLSSFTLSDFYARYQGIDLGTTPEVEDYSGIGAGTVPTPAMLPGLIGMGIAAWRKKKQQAKDAVSTSVT